MSSSIINVASSDDDIPGPSGLNIAYRKRSASSQTNIVSNTTTTSNNNTGGVLPASSIVSPSTSGNRAVPQTSSRHATTTNNKKAKTVPSKAFCLLWVCTHGKGRRRSWRKQDLKVVGIYATKAEAENAKRNIMGQYDCCGHGDILVGSTWEDEIDLVIREAPMNL